uniref:AAA+ ATPase domain-containing protein n=1 Tax=Leersia perrieri TaxID=77586 RepID=A0A0D9VGQ7_9ORYZ
MDRRKKNQQQQGIKEEKVVGPDHIAQIVSKWTGIPVASLGEDERKKLLELPRLLHRRVVGQEEAVVRSRLGLGNPGQPSGSFLFLGPTGVGKTELAKALAEQLFGNEKMLVRIDMSEYASSSSVTRLVGSAPGTQGHERGGQLTDRVRQRPYSVVLFNEVKKADAAVLNVFLQILDDGRLTDSHGRTVDFTSTIIIMTSNLGARHSPESARTASPRMPRPSTTAHFKPELINRLTETVVFRPLSGEQLRKVARRMQLRAMAARLAEKGIGLEVTDVAIDAVLARSSDQVRAYGRCLQKEVMTRISKMVVREEVDDDCYVVVDAGKGNEEGELVFTVDKQGDGSEENEPASAFVDGDGEEEEAEAAGEESSRD